MTHPRQQIRYAIRDRLAAPLPDGGFWTPAEDRVFTSRALNLAQEELPLIIIGAREEEAEPVAVTDFDDGYRRTLAIQVDCLTAAWEYDETEDLLDAMALGVEQAMDQLVIEGVETGRLRLTRTDIDIDREGETPIGAARLTYQCRYLSNRLGVDFGLWDRDYPTNCPAPGITQITLRSYMPQGDLDSSYETVTFDGDQAHQQDPTDPELDPGD
jgi:hypothetical protein